MAASTFTQLLSSDSVQVFWMQHMYKKMSEKETGAANLHSPKGPQKQAKKKKKKKKRSWQNCVENSPPTPESDA